MLLKICEDSFIFDLTHTNIVTFLCYLIIFVCLFLCLIIRNKNLFNKNKKTIFIRKALLVLSSLIFLIFLTFIFISTLNASSFNECSCKIVKQKIIETKNNKLAVNDIILNKLIIIGDSRMEQIETNKNIQIPNNISFIAKSGAKIDWFSTTALPELKSVLDNRNTDYKYHVLINMGVNDLPNNIVKKVASDYLKYYKELLIAYPNVEFYWLSVNPINPQKYIIRYSKDKYVSDKIETFNQILLENVKENQASNITFCDSYHEFTFYTTDGLHYTEQTGKQIINYIVNKCVKY